MKKSTYLSLLGFIMLFPLLVLGQRAGDLDRSFNYGLGPSYQFNNGYGTNGDIYSTTIQPDGKIIISGGFTTYNGTEINRIARLNSDGTIDTTFTPITGTNGAVNSVALQPDGKIIIVGQFTSCNNMVRNNLARLNSDGSIDSSFAPRTGANGMVNSVALQSDGRIVIGGNFTSYNGTARNYLARLNSDGSNDATFISGTGANGQIRSIALQTHNKIMIGGDFTSYNGIGRNRIARINAFGHLDTTFNPGSGANITVYSVELQDDGKIITGGAFNTFNGLARKSIARLNQNGSLDTTFKPGSGAISWVYSTASQTDGKIIIVGFFSSYNGTVRNNITRINSNGSLDTTFNYQSGANEWVGSIGIQIDGKIIIAGGFNSFNGVTRKRIALLNGNGSLDTIFNSGTGANTSVMEIALQPDGKIIIGGGFTTFNNIQRNYIARLNPDCSLDVTFNPGTGANNLVTAVALQTDGKIIIGGLFTFFNNPLRNRIARLNPNGIIDDTFYTGTGASGTVSSVALQIDGKIIIAGTFSSYNGTSRNRIARLSDNGNLDPAFNPGTGANNSVSTIAMQPDGKILIGGFFTAFNGIRRYSIARLGTNGGLDTTFNPGTGANTSVTAIAVQPDGKIIIGGSFTTFNNIQRNYIARLNPNGSLDTTFNPGTGANDWVSCIKIQTDGKIIIGGYFTSYNSVSRKHIARLNIDGSLDTTFNPRIGANSQVENIVSQPDGRIIIAGDFTGFNGLSTPYIARIHGSTITSTKKSTNAPKLKLYPNPTTGIVNITTSPEAESITIVNSVGQLVYTAKAQPQMELNLSSLASGVYMVQVQSSKGLTTQRLVIQ